MSSPPELNHNWLNLGIDLTSLKLFCAVVAEGSLVRAAEKEGIAVSAISRRLSHLEDRLGVQLLFRGGRGVKVTRAGKTLLSHIGLLFHGLDACLEDVRLSARATQIEELPHVRPDYEGKVTLHANLSAFLDFLPKALVTFARDYPRIQLSLQERTSSEIVLAVETGSADIGVIWDLGIKTDLEVVPCKNERLVVLLPEDHPMASTGTSVSFRELAAQPFVCISNVAPILHRCREEAMAVGHVLWERCEVSNLDCAKELVAAGIGIVIAPEASAAPDQNSHRIVHRPLSDTWAHRVLSLCFRSRSELSVEARLLMERLRGHAGSTRPSTLQT
jgi:DNA-binding transcriptional LysR family regulator